MTNLHLTISHQKMWANRAETRKVKLYKCCDESEPGMGICGLGSTPLESVQSFFASHPEYGIELHVTFVEGSQ